MTSDIMGNANELALHFPSNFSEYVFGAKPGPFSFLLLYQSFTLLNLKCLGF